MFKNTKVKLKDDVTFENFLSETFGSPDRNQGYFNFNTLKNNLFDAKINSKATIMNIDIKNSYGITVMLAYSDDNLKIWEEII